MSLQVRLVHHVEAQPVAQAIELGVVGIVGAAHRVEVVPLHQQQILLHVGRRHRVSRGGMVLVAVGAADQQGLAVDPQQAATDLHRTKAHVISPLSMGALLVQQGRGQTIKMGRLGAPRAAPPPPATARHGRRKPFFVDGAGAERLASLGDQRLTEIEPGLHRQAAALIDLQIDLLRRASR